MKLISEELVNEIEQLAKKLSDNPKLEKMFKLCFFNTLETTTELCEDGTTFIFTGDIPAMWLRDSTAQVRHYLPFCNKYGETKRVIEGLIKRQFEYIKIDGYANSFNKNPDGRGYQDVTEKGPWVWERKYEVDSLCYPVQLLYLYWKETGDVEIFDEKIKSGLTYIIEQWKREQTHNVSEYRFQRKDCVPSDTLRNGGAGMPVNYTGMTWSGFRPSDDACRFGYLIPSNMFAVVALGYIIEIAENLYKDDELSEEAAMLREEIEYGINTYGIYEHPVYGKIYAYETDGFGNYNLMDDANVPSLLSIPYIGYRSSKDEIYQNTRRFILSSSNPYYYEGSFAKGIGSPHTPKGYIWPIGLTMEAITCDDPCRVKDIITKLLVTDGGTDFMHESFNPNNPAEYTREWFAWANSLFAEMVYNNLICNIGL